jgi:hypothetical protein
MSKSKSPIGKICHIDRGLNDVSNLLGMFYYRHGVSVHMHVGGDDLGPIINYIVSQSCYDLFPIDVKFIEMFLPECMMQTEKVEECLLAVGSRLWWLNEVGKEA